jgi:tetratricopeptide (TPR) repeat protein
MVDTIQPFDLFYKIQDAMHLLPRQTPYYIPSEDERGKILEGLTASQDCLKFYFREVHGLPIRRDNIYMEVAQTYWDRNNIDKALEYYRKALARTHGRTAERIECLYGLRDCYAIQGNRAACIEIERELGRVRPKHVSPTPWERRRSVVTITSIIAQKFFRVRVHRRGEHLPEEWPIDYGELNFNSSIDQTPENQDSKANPESRQKDQPIL